MDYRNILPGDTETMVSYSPRARSGCHLLSITRQQVAIEPHLEYGETGSRPGEYRNLTLYVRMPQALHVATLREGLAEGGELAALLDRITAGHTHVIDQNSVKSGVLTSDADAAFDKLVEALDPNDSRYGSTIEVWSARDWLTASSTIAAVLAEYSLTADSTDERWDEVIEDLLSEARSNDQHVDEDDLRAVLEGGIEDDE